MWLPCQWQVSCKSSYTGIAFLEHLKLVLQRDQIVFWDEHTVSRGAGALKARYMLIYGMYVYMYVYVWIGGRDVGVCGPGEDAMAAS